MESKTEGVDRALHDDAIEEFYFQWLVIACVHVPLNVVLSLSFLRWVNEPLLLTLSATIVVSLAIVGLLALNLKRAVKVGKPATRFFGVNSFPVLVCAIITYAMTWSGMVWMVFANGTEAGISAVTILAVLLSIVTIRFSSVRGSLARLLVAIQMSSVALLWSIPDHPWAYFYVAGLVLMALVMLGNSHQGSQAFISSYRLRRRQARLQRELRLRNRLLQMENSSKSRLLAMASHDLRQPVHALGLLMALLRNDPAANEVRERIETINTVVESLARKLEKLMALARLDAGTTQVDIEVVNLHRIFLSLECEFMQIAVEKGLAIKFIAGEELNVRSDSTLLRIVLANIIANAIRYTSEGEVCVIAEVVDGMVRLEVRDTGIGIPSDRIADIFEAFVRLNSSVRDPDGLGLGLAIARRIAELLSIKIFVRSVECVGTTFSIYAPCALGQSQAEKSSCNVDGFRRLRVLAIDDDRVVLQSMAQTLEAWGCQVVSATCGPEVDAKLNFVDNPFDLIITDYHLVSGSSGIDIIRRVRRKYAFAVPAIVLTGDVEIRVHDELEAENLLIAHKPISPFRLSAAIERLRAQTHSFDFDPGVCRAREGLNKSTEHTHDALT